MADTPPWVIAVAGSSGAIVANALVYPLDIVKTRLQVQMDPQADREPDSKTRRYKGTLHAVQDILKHEGAAGLYSGLPGTSLSTAATNFVYFYAYSTLRTLFGNVAGASIAADLGLGTAAGAIVSLIITPIAVVTTTQQTAREAKSMAQTAREIFADAGLPGLWSGIKASLVLSVNPAITYGAYEQLRTALYPASKLRPHEAFCKYTEKK